jgi:hypothetical protein
MASKSGTNKQTFAKLQRERAVKERRLRKQEKREARKLAQSEPEPAPDAEEGFASP